MNYYDNNRVKKKSKLLVIDDNGQTQMLIRDLLEDTGINIIESDCGIKAFEIVKDLQDQIGLILLDIYLPDCDGGTLAEQIRQLSPNIPILAISAMLPVELAENCRSAGLNGYFSKPLDIIRLKETIISYLCQNDN